MQFHSRLVANQVQENPHTLAVGDPSFKNPQKVLQGAGFDSDPVIGLKMIALPDDPVPIGSSHYDLYDLFGNGGRVISAQPQDFFNPPSPSDQGIVLFKVELPKHIAREKRLIFLVYRPISYDKVLHERIEDFQPLHRQIRPCFFFFLRFCLDDIPRQRRVTWVA